MLFWSSFIIVEYVFSFFGIVLKKNQYMKIWIYKAYKSFIPIDYFDYLYDAYK